MCLWNKTVKTQYAITITPCTSSGPNAYLQVVLILSVGDLPAIVSRSSGIILTKNVVFWDVTPYCSCKNRRIGGTYRLNHQVEKGFPRSELRLLVAANVVTSSPILVTWMTEAICSSESSVLTSTTRRNIPKDGILHSQRRENLKSYIALTGWAQ
jgi:hypothetical protein